MKLMKKLLALSLLGIGSVAWGAQPKKTTIHKAIDFHAFLYIIKSYANDEKIKISEKNTNTWNKQLETDYKLIKEVFGADNSKIKTIEGNAKKLIDKALLESIKQPNINLDHEKLIPAINKIIKKYKLGSDLEKLDEEAKSTTNLQNIYNVKDNALLLAAVVAEVGTALQEWANELKKAWVDKFFSSANGKMPFRFRVMSHAAIYDKLINKKDHDETLCSKFQDLIKTEKEAIFKENKKPLENLMFPDAEAQRGSSKKEKSWKISGKDIQAGWHATREKAQQGFKYLRSQLPEKLGGTTAKYQAQEGGVLAALPSLNYAIYLHSHYKNIFGIELPNRKLQAAVATGLVIGGLGAWSKIHPTSFKRMKESVTTNVSNAFSKWGTRSWTAFKSGLSRAGGYIGSKAKQLGSSTLSGAKRAAHFVGSGIKNQTYGRLKNMTPKDVKEHLYYKDWNKKD